MLVGSDELAALDAAGLAKIIRQRALRFGQADGTTGGNSTKQVRFDFSLPHHSVITSLRLRRVSSQSGVAISTIRIERLDVATQRKVTALQIRHAVDQLLSGEDASSFADSRDYDLITTAGDRLAPKKVFGLALEAALGIKAMPGHFSAGWGEPCFDLLLEAGFRIIPKDAAISISPPSDDMTDLPHDPEERSWAEGNIRFRQHLRTERRRDPAAAAARRNAVRAQNQGRLACENPACVVDWYDIFPVAIAESVFDIHHRIPVAVMAEGHRTGLEDLACLCASCHRAEHRRMALESRTE